MLNNELQIQLKVKDVITSEGAELIDFKIFHSGSKRILRCIVDYPSGGITLSACGMINKKVFAYINESNVLGDDCIVEVNSPGLDRPLKKRSDFLKVNGRIVCLWLNEPVLDRRYLEAEVLGIGQRDLSLKYKDKSIKIDFSKIKLGKEKIEI